LNRLIQHDDIFIRHFQTRVWPFELHNHNHFELLFIHSGKGVHQLNGELFRYQGPCFYVLAPTDEHIFNIEEESMFTVLKFTNVYLGQHASQKQKDSWEQLVQQLIITSKSHEGFVTGSADLAHLGNIMLAIAREWARHPVPANEVILHLIRSVFAMLKRDIPITGQERTHAEELTRTLHYIHEHITDPVRLQQSVMAPELQLSKNKLLVLFKQELGVSVKDYINEYKCRQIENKLRYSDLSIKEISARFGFGDLSHLNKFFRKMKGINPRLYRSQINPKDKAV
jgi:AraC-like DNA-binding protein